MHNCCINRIKNLYKGKDGNLYYIKDGVLYFAELKNKNVVIPDGVVKIANTTFFEQNKFIESVVVPESVQEIESFTFEDCSNLKSINIKGKIKALYISTFSGCVNLKHINLPYTIEEISYDAFRDCINLQNLVFPENLKRIGISAFCGCSNLNTVVLPTGISAIDTESFMDCTNLERIILEKIPRDYSEIVRAIGSDNFKELLLITEDKDTIVPYAILTSGKLQIISSNEVKKQIEYNSMDKYYDLMDWDYRSKELTIATSIAEKLDELSQIQEKHHSLIKHRPKP